MKKGRQKLTTGGGRFEMARRKRGKERTAAEERLETLSLGIIVTEQVKRDKCQRTLGEIKQQLACTHPGERESATARESEGTRRGTTGSKRPEIQEDKK